MRISQTGQSRRSRPRGFTLLELLVVLVILGFFSSLLALRIENVFSGGDLRLASRIIIGEVKRFRGRAAYTHKDQVMGFEIGRNGLYPVETPSPQGTLPEGMTLNGERPPEVTYLPAGVIFEDVVTPLMGKIQDGEARIRFFANGCVERSLIHLKNEAEGAYTLEVNPLTGNVKVHDRYVDQSAEE